MMARYGSELNVVVPGLVARCGGGFVVGHRLVLYRLMLYRLVLLAERWMPLSGSTVRRDFLCLDRAEREGTRSTGWEAHVLAIAASMMNPLLGWR